MRIFVELHPSKTEMRSKFSVLAQDSTQVKPRARWDCIYALNLLDLHSTFGIPDFIHGSLMAFRKRNVAVGRTIADSPSQELSTQANIPGVRPSISTSHPVTSTGAASVDSLLGGHGGLALGCSLLVEESGTTDFAGALLRYYAAEGICHGQVLHIVGVGDAWVRELPGVVESKSSRTKDASSSDAERMKIAWRYEKLGQAGERGAWTTNFSV